MQVAYSNQMPEVAQWGSADEACLFLVEPRMKPRVIDDHARVGPLADLFDVIPCLDPEIQTTAIELDQLGAGAHAHANRRCGEMLDIDLDANRRLSLL